MKKKLLCGAVLVALTLNLVACGDGSDDTGASQHVMDLIPESSVTDEKETTEVQTDENADAEGNELTAEDYLTLAEQYKEQGLIRKQRDVLEKSYRLYGDQAAFDSLQSISVNLEEEDGVIQEQANLMLQNLELVDYLGESVNLISTNEWMDTMMPKLYEGTRSYFLQKGGQTVLFIQVGYSQVGEPIAKVWYLGEQVRVLRREGSTVQLLETGMADGNYQGAFTSWTLEGSTGNIYQETGTFGNGVLTGDYTIAIHEGTEGSDIFSLWNNKEGMKYTTYDGHFNEQGISTLEQPAAKKIASLISDTEYNSCIVYAIDVKDCLFEGLAEGEEPATYVFGIEKMGWESIPSFTVYEPVSDTQTSTEEEKKTDIQVRVFDGELQIYQSGKWIGMGSVEEYMKADPFLAYENNRQNADENSGENLNALGHRRAGGTIPKDKVVTKPATQTPAQQQQPQQTPQQQQPQQQAPQQSAPAPTPPTNNGNGNSNNGNTNSGNSNGGNADSGNTGGDTGNGGNETDVEWTPDML